jgi:phage terminase small subunit
MNPRQERFAAEYVLDLNGAAAARRAGYTGSDASLAVSASRLLRDAKVAELIEQKRLQRAEATGINAKTVLIRLNDVANRCMQVVPVMHYDHKTKSMVQVQKENEAGQMVGLYEFDAAGANRALELLGKHFGMFREVIEHKGIGDLGQRLARARERRKHSQP